MSEQPRRLALVTGTSGGLGRAIAQRLIADGFFVCGLARREVVASELGVPDDSYVHTTLDLADIESIPGVAADVVKKHGVPYALVNNSGVGIDGLLPTLHNSEIERAVTVNLVGPMILTKYIVRRMISVREGRVVNVSSIVARTGYRGLSAYGAAKAGLEGFTRSLARDVGRRGVTVNAVAPGFLATEMTDSLDEQNLQRIKNRSALSRFAETSEVANGVGFLCSPEASGVTGTVLTIDAGTTA